MFLGGSAYLSNTHFSSFLLHSLSSLWKDTRHLFRPHSHLEWHLWKSDYRHWICISKWIALNGWEMSWRMKHCGVATAFASRSLVGLDVLGVMLCSPFTSCLLHLRWCLIISFLSCFGIEVAISGRERSDSIRCFIIGLLFCQESRRSLRGSAHVQSGGGSTM